MRAPISDKLEDTIKALKSQNPDIVSFCKQINQMPRFNEKYNFLLEHFKLMDKSILFSKYANVKGTFFDNEWKDSLLDMLVLTNPNFDVSKIEHFINNPQEITTDSQKIVYSSLQNLSAYFKLSHMETPDEGKNAIDSMIQNLYNINKNIANCIIDCLFVKIMSGEISFQDINEEFKWIGDIPYEQAEERALEIIKNKDILKNYSQIENEMIAFKCKEGNWEANLNHINDILQDTNITKNDISNLFNNKDSSTLMKDFAIKYPSEISYLADLHMQAEAINFYKNENEINQTFDNKNLSNKLTDKYLSMFFKKKLLEIQNDKNFVAQCNNLRQYVYKDLDAMIAGLGLISQIEVKDKLLDYQNNFTAPQILTHTKENLCNDAREFFKWCDYTKSDSNNFSFTENFDKNIKHLCYDPIGYRSWCSFSGNKQIYLGGHQTFEDKKILCHEMTHSFSDPFENGKHENVDINLAESSTMLVNRLASLFFEKKYPEIKNDFESLNVDKKINIVYDCRMLLMEALVCKIATEPNNLNNIVELYGPYFLQNESELAVVLQSLETNTLNPLVEFAYIIPSLLSEEIIESDKGQPNVIIDKLTYLIQNLDKIDHNQMIKDLGYGDSKTLFNRYALNYEERFDKINKLEDSNLSHTIDDFLEKEKIAEDGKSL